MRSFLPRPFVGRSPRSCSDYYVKIVHAALDKGCRSPRRWSSATRPPSARPISCSSPSRSMDRARERRTALDDYAVAARLSYFLWSSMPDNELMRTGGQGGVDQARGPAGPGRTDAQRSAGRGGSPRISPASGSTCARSTPPRPTRRLYGEFDDFLFWSMPRETQLFFEEILPTICSLTDFVHSDWTILNERLAKHYGIPGVDRRRIAQGEAPARQPPRRRHDAGQRPEGHGRRHADVAGAARQVGAGADRRPTARPAAARRARHRTRHPRRDDDPPATRQAPQHAGLRHVPRHIDPPGFALENFDVIGGWRDFYRGTSRRRGAGRPGQLSGPSRSSAVSTSRRAARRPTARPFKDIDEYKQLLLADKDQLARNLAQKL